MDNLIELHKTAGKETEKFIAGVIVPKDTIERLQDKGYGKITASRY